MTAEANQEPGRIRSEIEALLTELPDPAGLQDAELDEIARRLAAAHDTLVQALESVERG